MHLSKFILAFLVLTAATPVFACDLCGCYTPCLEVVREKPLTFYCGVAEQFTHFGTDRIDGHKVANPTGEHLDSSITQAFIGVRFLQDRVGLQLNVPYIYRSFQRPEGFAINHGAVSGLGDVSLLANVVVFDTGGATRKVPGAFSKDGKSTACARVREPDFSASFNVLAGLKFPTGDESRIKEEFHEVDVEGAPESGIHGHDLALGTGSYDGIFGAQTLVRFRALFFQADVQYALRRRGHYAYRYADSLGWSGGPGVYLWRRGGDSLALQCVLAGETKGYDTFQGEPAADTGVTALYVGPRVSASFRNVSADVGVDLPAIMNTTSFQSTPDYRIRAGLSIRF